MHRIRLRGSWDISSDGIRTIHARRFGQPRLPDAGESVWLVCDWVPGPAELSINEELIGVAAAAGPLAFDVTDRLRARNAVVLAVRGDGELGEVAVEIRSAAS